MKPPASSSRPGDANQAALRRLGVSAKELAAAPAITPLLKRADGGIKATLAAMRFSNEPVIRAFLAKYNSLSGHDQKHLPLEAIALAAEINVVHLFGAILLALRMQAVNTVKIIAMTAHPKITQARVEYGQLPLGERDRTALDVAMGFLPSPKGPTFIGKAIFGPGENVMDQQRGDEADEDGYAEPDLDRLFPPANAMQQKLQLVRQRTILPPPSDKAVN
jgi:hypothetical protein